MNKRPLMKRASYEISTKTLKVTTHVINNDNLKFNQANVKKADLILNYNSLNIPRQC